MKKILFQGSLLTLALGISNCSTIRMNYEADLKVDSNKETTFHFEKSYDVGSYPVLCALTGIFFGGACWFYTVMPTTGQTEEVRTDAEIQLEKLMGSQSYEIQSTQITRKSWENKEPVSLMGATVP